MEPRLNNIDKFYQHLCFAKTVVLIGLNVAPEIGLLAYGSQTLANVLLIRFGVIRLLIY